MNALRKIKLLYPLAIVFLVLNNVYSQDIHFSNMDYSPLSVNPALAGVNSDYQANLSYRNQWNSVSTPFQTIAASADMRFNNNQLGNGFLALGINFFNDQIGNPRLNTNKANLSLAYNLYLGRNNAIALGINAGILNRSINEQNGQWGNQYDGLNYDVTLPTKENFANNSFVSVTTGAGAIYSYNADDGKRIRMNESFSFNGGFAIYHLNRPNYSFLNDEGDKLLMRMSLFANASIVFSNSMMGIDPAIYIQQQGASREIVFGSDYKFFFKEASKYTGFVNRSSFSAGLYYRIKDAIITRAIIEFSNYAIGLSYDFNVSSLTEVSRGRGGAEIFLRWQL